MIPQDFDLFVYERSNDNTDNVNGVKARYNAAVWVRQFIGLNEIKTKRYNKKANSFEEFAFLFKQVNWC